MARWSGDVPFEKLSLLQAMLLKKASTICDAAKTVFQSFKYYLAQPFDWTSDVATGTFLRQERKEAAKEGTPVIQQQPLLRRGRRSTGKICQGIANCSPTTNYASHREEPATRQQVYAPHGQILTPH